MISSQLYTPSNITLFHTIYTSRTCSSLLSNNPIPRLLGRFWNQTWQPLDPIILYLPLSSSLILCVTAGEEFLAFWHTTSAGVFPYLFLTVVLMPGKVIRNATISS